ncbi:MAG: response regulator [Caryophanon sp.]|nr:response regulator [Caryophanon sp.]
MHTQQHSLPLHIAKRFFDLLKSNMTRTKSSMCIVGIKLLESNEQQLVEMEAFLLHEIRKNDALFHMQKGYIGILLTQSGERETLAFLQRILNNLNEGIVAHVTEVRNEQAQFPLIVEAAEHYLQHATTRSHIEVNTAYNKPEKELVKVSILESNEIFRNVLQAEVNNLQLPHFTLQTKSFDDGQAFLQSDFYQSSHMHVVIVNDVLPRKNGMAVLHQLRSMPNEKKFIIYMMTSRLSEQEMITAYKAGADHYLIKPFNLRLFEAQIARAFERLWT